LQQQNGSGDLVQQLGLAARRGHFLYESGHHGDLWLDLEALCCNPGKLQPLIDELAKRLASYSPEVVCGPLIEGALIALLVARTMNCQFAYAIRFASSNPQRLFSVRYTLPHPQREIVSRRRVAIVNDVISAGSAVRGTLLDLQSLEADVVCIASLVVVGDFFGKYAAAQALPLERLATTESTIWPPSDCPLCRSNVPLEQLATH
jgi:orotate phosphoribosyltransferase